MVGVKIIEQALFINKRFRETGIYIGIHVCLKG